MCLDNDFKRHSFWSDISSGVGVRPNVMLDVVKLEQMTFGVGIYVILILYCKRPIYGWKMV